MSRIRGAVPRAVFVDGTGRRRQFVTVAGAGLAVALLVALGLLISGLSGRSPLRLPGLPKDAGAPAAVHSSSGVAPDAPGARLVPSPIPTPTAASRAPSRTPAPGRASASATAHGRRPSQTPAHPVQSKRK